MKRYAMVTLRSKDSSDLETVKRYLPGNYQVIGTAKHQWGKSETAVDLVAVVAGEDNHGWTLDRYVIPRLGSGLYAATEIDLSHPVMMQIDA